MNNKMNCLSYWFPKIVGIPGIKTPRTEIVRTKLPLYSLLDGKDPEPTDGETWHGLLDSLSEAVKSVGGAPAFMRTGQGSGKHEWRDTCFLKDATRETIGQHVCQLVEWSELVDMFGLPYDVWVIRELLPTRPAFTAFKDMPIVKERRYFIQDGRTVCRHPYWPAEAFSERYSRAPDGWREQLDAMNNETMGEWAELTELSDRVGAAIGGDWSIDWLWTDRGWYLTDMATAGDSFHWAGCAKAELFKRSDP